MNNDNNTTRRRELKIVVWNMNGIGGKHKYIQTLLNSENLDVVFISETKMKRPIVPHLDIGNDNYNLIQLRSTINLRGGMVALSKN